MTNRITSSIQQLMRMGIRDETSFIETQKTYMFNLFLLIASPFALISLVLNLIGQAYLPALLNLFQLAVFSVGFSISARQKGLHYRSWLLLTLSVIAVLAAYYYKNGSEYRLFVMMIAAVVLFDRNWQYLFFSSLVSIVFVLVRIDDMGLAGKPAGEVVGNTLKILIPLFLFAMSLLYFKHIYFRNLLQLEKTNKELSIAKEEKQRILNAVAHDLRSPVSNISGICYVMLADNQFTTEQKEWVLLIQQASDNSLSLISDLLQNNDTGIHRIMLKRIDLNSLVGQCISLLQLTAGKKDIQIQADYCTEPLPVNIDKHKIERVITNLVNNAIKFSPAKTVINIQLERESNNALVVVRDSGIGIPKENHKKIFDMFTHAGRKGTAGETSYGMGLSICKQIMEDHGGSIAVESEVGEGSSFFVRLPFHQL